MKKVLFLLFVILFLVSCSSVSFTFTLPHKNSGETTNTTTSNSTVTTGQDNSTSNTKTSKNKKYKQFESYGYDVEGEDLFALAEVLYASGDFNGSYRMLDTIGFDTNSIPALYKDNRKQWVKIQSGVKPERDDCSEELLDYLIANQLFDYKSYKMGEIGPAGGYVFYDKGYYSDGWRFLEAAPSDVRVVDGSPSVDRSAIDYYSAPEGYCFGYNIVYYPYKDGLMMMNAFVNGNNEYDKSCTKTDIGTGANNTTLLVNAMGDQAYLSMSGSTKTENYAAKLCDVLEYTNNGVVFDDWFLPSKDELNLMYVNLKQRNIGGLADSYYWSSSESSGTWYGEAIYAWYQFFYRGSGEQRSTSRGDDTSSGWSHNYNVRPIRAF